MNKASTSNPTSKNEDKNSVVDEAKNALSHVATDVKERAVDTVNHQFGTRRDDAVGTMGGVASTIRETGEKLKGVGPLAGVAGRAADGVEKFADFFEGKQIGDVVREVERYARREPAIFLGAAFAIGLIGGRFLKSSAHRSESEEGMGIQGSGPRVGYAPPPPRPTPKRFSAESPSAFQTQRSKNEARPEGATWPGVGRGGSGSV